MFHDESDMIGEKRSQGGAPRLMSLRNFFRDCSPLISTVDYREREQIAVCVGLDVFGATLVEQKWNFHELSDSPRFAVRYCLI